MQSSNFFYIMARRSPPPPQFYIYSRHYLQVNLENMMGQTALIIATTIPTESILKVAKNLIKKGVFCYQETAY